MSDKERNWRDMWKWFQERVGGNISYSDFVILQRELDIGKLSLYSFYKKAFRIMELKYTRKDLIKISRPVIRKTKLNPKIRDIVLKLKAHGYIVPLLSNSINEIAKSLRKRGCYKIFYPVFISCETGFSKNDGELYVFALKKLQLKPQECIIIDDNPDFVKYAKRVGIKTILYDNPIKLRADLKSFGISI